MANSSPIEPFSRVKPRLLKRLLRLPFVLLVAVFVGVLVVTLVSSE